MGLFSRKNSSPVWRDTNGKISCPGDNCRQRICDDTCPIYLNTQAMMMSQFGQKDAQLSLYGKILSIAPDYYDAWNNSGAIYGEKGQYQTAYDCYSMAHKLSPDRSAPIFGLALASKDLHRYEECLDWCAEYDKLSSDHRLDETRRIAQQALNTSNASAASISRAVSLAADMLKDGEELGFIQDASNFPHIPEIMIQAKPVCEELTDILITNNISYSLFINKGKLVASLACSFYAAYGAVALWQDDWPSLQQKGIINSLSESRGFDLMDEYAMDYAGPKYNSREEKKLRSHITDEANNMIDLIRKTSVDFMDAQFEECMKAMFYYGMVMEMGRLGMH